MLGMSYSDYFISGHTLMNLANTRRQSVPITRLRLIFWTKVDNFVLWFLIGVHFTLFSHKRSQGNRVCDQDRDYRTLYRNLTRIRKGRTRGREEKRKKEEERKGEGEKERQYYIGGTLIFRSRDGTRVPSYVSEPKVGLPLLRSTLSGVRDGCCT